MSDFIWRTIGVSSAAGCSVVVIPESAQPELKPMPAWLLQENEDIPDMRRIVASLLVGDSLLPIGAGPAEGYFVLPDSLIDGFLADHRLVRAGAPQCDGSILLNPAEPLGPIDDVQVVQVLPETCRGPRCVVVNCPYCSKRHMHGWPNEDGDTAPGWRTSHCASGIEGGQYFIAAPSTETH